MSNTNPFLSGGGVKRMDLERSAQWDSDELQVGRLLDDPYFRDPMLPEFGFVDGLTFNFDTVVPLGEPIVDDSRLPGPRGLTPPRTASHREESAEGSDDLWCGDEDEGEGEDDLELRFRKVMGYEDATSAREKEARSSSVDEAAVLAYFGRAQKHRYHRFVLQCAFREAWNAHKPSKPKKRKRTAEQSDEQSGEKKYKFELKAQRPSSIANGKPFTRKDLDGVADSIKPPTHWTAGSTSNRLERSNTCLL
jgi:hypothetical protein